jgi:hypothetical protein
MEAPKRDDLQFIILPVGSFSSQTRPFTSAKAHRREQHRFEIFSRLLRRMGDPSGTFIASTAEARQMLYSLFSPSINATSLAELNFSVLEKEMERALGIVPIESDDILEYMEEEYQAMLLAQTQKACDHIWNWTATSWKQAYRPMCVVILSDPLVSQALAHALSQACPVGVFPHYMVTDETKDIGTWECAPWKYLNVTRSLLRTR